MRRTKELESTSLEAPRKTSRFKVLRGEGGSTMEWDGMDPELGRIDENLGGYLANPMWLPGHLFEGAERPEAWIPSALES
ncbi:hypothetical protein [[Pseudopropionibacterium] massiliense]|uniref:hypothetical protein n=1 Tax=[Pseudopropionibacterium] massiliense TaxID=2220000 RepID=UPI00102FE78D|nr:hypothetical protein [[Pseudopropionibacterium] massiliense]